MEYTPHTTESIHNDDNEKGAERRRIHEQILHYHDDIVTHGGTHTYAEKSRSADVIDDRRTGIKNIWIARYDLPKRDQQGQAIDDAPRDKSTAPQYNTIAVFEADTNNGMAVPIYHEEFQSDQNVPIHRIRRVQEQMTIAGTAETDDPEGDTLIIEHYATDQEMKTAGANNRETRVSLDDMKRFALELPKMLALSNEATSAPASPEGKYWERLWLVEDPKIHYLSIIKIKRFDPKTGVPEVEVLYEETVPKGTQLASADLVREQNDGMGNITEERDAGGNLLILKKNVPMQEGDNTYSTVIKRVEVPSQIKRGKDFMVPVSLDSTETGASPQPPRSEAAPIIDIDMVDRTNEEPTPLHQPAPDIAQLRPIKPERTHDEKRLRNARILASLKFGINETYTPSPSVNILDTPRTDVALVQDYFMNKEGRSGTVFFSVQENQKTGAVKQIELTTIPQAMNIGKVEIRKVDELDPKEFGGLQADPNIDVLIVYGKGEKDEKERICYFAPLPPEEL